VSFKVKFSTNDPIPVKFNAPDAFAAKFDKHIVVPVTNYYDGEYSITPADEPQTIPIIGKTARQNITVGAIPNNYGLITWNGSTITVS